MPEGTAVEHMFAGIAGRYDLANRVLSGGIDTYWRARLVRKVAARKPAMVADLATGSGDVALALRRRLPPACHIAALDFCEPMLEQARAKQSQRAIPTDTLSFRFGDCLNLPLADHSVDVVTIAFGLRNLEDRHRGLLEMRRVLRPGTGTLFVLEFSQPYPWFRPVYYAYLRFLLPFLAASMTGDRSAYQYLVGSIHAFPSREQLCAELSAAGFSSVKATALTGSAVAIHQGVA